MSDIGSQQHPSTPDPTSPPLLLSQFLLLFSKIFFFKKDSEKEHPSSHTPQGYPFILTGVVDPPYNPLYYPPTHPLPPAPPAPASPPAPTGAPPMPITQSRMIALINAANDYKSALETILDSIRTLADDISQSKTTPAAAFQYLEAMASTRSLLSRPSASPSTIALEHYHFARNHRRNSRVANQQAASRRAAGIQPRPTNDFPYQTTNLYGFTPPKPQALANPFPIPQPSRPHLSRHRRGLFLRALGRSRRPRVRLRSRRPFRRGRRRLRQTASPRPRQPRQARQSNQDKESNQC